MEVDEEDRFGPSLQEFVEVEEVLALVDDLPSAVGDIRTREIAEQRFTGECVSLYTL